MEDTSALSARAIMSMGQTELLDCILNRLEELETSQTRTSLQVRVLARRLIHEAPHPSDDFQLDESTIATESLKERYEEDLEQEIEVMMNGDGEDEAWLLASMRKGTPVTLLPFEEMKVVSG